nr:glycosyltransferase family 4 protein [Nocardioides thalensis]
MITQARGGPVDHAVDVAVELARTGHESHLVGPPGDHLATAARGGVVTHSVEVRSKTDLGGARAVAAVVDRVRPDVVHLQDRRAGLVGRAVTARRSVPSVYTLHGVPDQLAGLVPGNLVMSRPRRRDRLTYLTLERLLATTPRSAVVAPCEALSDYLRDHVGVRPERVRTVHNGVGREWVREVVPADRQATGRAAGPVRATWLGVMQPVKRVPDLVRALARVPGTELELVGDGPERGRIEAAVASDDVSDRVRFAGYRDDPAPYLRGTDVFVLPSAAEACPMALLQAMASGVPVIASRVGGVAEIVRDGVDGLLVEPGSVDELADALRRVSTDADLRRRLGAAGRARVVDLFLIERTVDSLLDVYREVAALPRESAGVGGAR